MRTRSLIMPGRKRSALSAALSDSEVDQRQADAGPARGYCESILSERCAGFLPSQSHLSPSPPPRLPALSPTTQFPETSSPLLDTLVVVVELEQRRKIQNRIAQRKFREKSREHRERLERELRNRQYAAGTYQVIEPADVPEPDGDLLPWGGINIRHVISRGLRSESLRASSGVTFDAYRRYRRAPAASAASTCSSFLPSPPSVYWPLAPPSSFLPSPVSPPPVASFLPKPPLGPAAASSPRRCGPLPFHNVIGWTAPRVSATLLGGFDARSACMPEPVAGIEPISFLD